MMLACLLICEPTFAQTAQDPSTEPDNPAAAQNSVKLAGVLMALPTGAPWLSFRLGAICVGSPDVQTWTAGRVAQNLSPYFGPFKTELERAGYKAITPGEDNLFDPDAASSDYEAAAVITDAQIEGCVSEGGLFRPDRGNIRGDGSMKIDWQLYSRLRKQVVARASTSGTAKLDKSVPGGVARLITEAFASNVRELAANAGFRTALSAPKAFTKGFVLPGQQSKIVLAGSLKAPTRHIDDAVGSVVMLFTGSGSGSGVLVSEDGYILTNAHVVGDDTAIRVRWPDRVETLAQVVRVAKDRDVAIIKTNPRDRMPLAIKRGAVTPGQRVYAIGTPLDKAFQSSVSSGVVSANRTIDGLRYIQSDTSISPGSSGGALLDETGSVIGIAVAQYRNDGPTGINIFIPIGDAMDFLSLEQH